jgi:hypothetical protein
MLEDPNQLGRGLRVRHHGNRVLGRSRASDLIIPWGCVACHVVDDRGGRCSEKHPMLGQVQEFNGFVSFSFSMVLKRNLTWPLPT